MTKTRIRQDLLDRAKQLGLDVNKRWSTKRLAAAVKAAAEADINTKVAHARDVANRIRAIAPAKAAEIDKAIEDLAAGKRDGLNVTASISFKLEKFEAPAGGAPLPPDAVPFETITGTDNI